MKAIIARFVRDESGATAIEYGLICAIIAIGIIASLGTLRDALAGVFANIAAALNVN